jgi:hypothetical protein
MRLLALLPLLLVSCQSVTITTPDGTRIKSTNTGDFGNIAITDATGSAGGLSSIISGDVSTKRATSFQETSPGYMKTTANGVVVEFGGVINNSTVVARHWDGATSAIRNWVSRLIAGDMFNSIDTKTKESEKTSRNATNRDAQVDITRSNNELSARKAEAKSE